MSIEITKQPIQVIDGIEIENRLHSVVNYRVEMRGRKMVIIIEPGLPETNGLILPGHLLALPKGASDV